MSLRCPFTQQELESMFDTAMSDYEKAFRNLQECSKDFILHADDLSINMVAKWLSICETHRARVKHYKHHLMKYYNVNKQ